LTREGKITKERAEIPSEGEGTGRGHRERARGEGKGRGKREKAKRGQREARKVSQRVSPTYPPRVWVNADSSCCIDIAPEYRSYAPTLWSWTVPSIGCRV